MGRTQQCHQGKEAPTWGFETNLLQLTKGSGLHCVIKFWATCEGNQTQRFCLAQGHTVSWDPQACQDWPGVAEEQDPIYPGGSNEDSWLFPRPGLRPFYLSLTVRVSLSPSCHRSAHMLELSLPWALGSFPVSPRGMLPWDLSGLGDASPCVWQGKLESLRRNPFFYSRYWAPLVLWQQLQAGGRNGRVVSSGWCCQIPHAPRFGEESVIHSPKTYWALTAYQALF